MSKLSLSDSELLIMQFLWTEAENGREGKTFSEIQSYASDVLGKTWKKQTVNTFLTRLKGKNFVSVENRSGKHLYITSMSRTDYALLLWDEILPPEKLPIPKVLVAAFSEGYSPTPQEKEELIQFINDL